MPLTKGERQRPVFNPGVISGGFLRKVKPLPPEPASDQCEDVIIETINTTGLAAFKRRLRRSNANVLCAQEVGILKHRVPDEVNWAMKKGWQLIVAPSLPGEGHSTSAGVAIAVRLGYTIQLLPEGSEIVEGRLLAVLVTLGSWPTALIGSAYMHTGNQLSKSNKHILAAWASVQSRVGHLSHLAGDFNFNSRLLDKIGYHDKAGTCALVPQKGKYTCVTAKGASIIDYFVVTSSYAELNPEIQVLKRTGVATHNPVQAIYRQKHQTKTQLQFVVRPKMPTALPFGPLNRRPDTTKLAEEVKATVMSAYNDKPSQALAAITHCYASLANHMECELASVLDFPIAPDKFGLRARELSPCWKPVIDNQTRLAPSESIHDVAMGWTEAVKLSMQATTVINNVASTPGASKDMPEYVELLDAVVGDYIGMGLSSDLNSANNTSVRANRANKTIRSQCGSILSKLALQTQCEKEKQLSIVRWPIPCQASVRRNYHASLQLRRKSK